MAITVRGVTTNSGNPVSTVSITPVGGTVAGDVVLVIGFRNGADPSHTLIDDNGSTPFTKQRSDYDTANGADLSIFYRRIVGGDPSSFTFKHNTAGQGDTTLSLVAITLQDPDGSTVFDVAPSGATVVTSPGDGGSLNAAAVTSSVSNCIHVIATLRSGGAYTNLPSGYTATNGAGGLHEGGRCFYKTITSAGTTGAQTLTEAGSSSAVIQSFLLFNTSAPAGGVFLLAGKLIGPFGGKL